MIESIGLTPKPESSSPPLLLPITQDEMTQEQSATQRVVVSSPNRGPVVPLLLSHSRARQLGITTI